MTTINQNITFKNLSDKDREMARAIIYANDSQLNQIASIQSKQDLANSATVKSGRVFSNFLPVADSFIQGATRKGKLSGKIGKGLDVGKDWAVFIAATKIYNSAVNSIVNNVPFLRRFREDHPMAYTVGNTAGGVATGMSAISLVNAGIDKIRATKIYQNLGIENKEQLAKRWIDTNPVGRKINAGMRLISAKFPRTTERAGRIAPYILPALAVGWLVSYLTKLAGLKGNQQDKFMQLKQAQVDSARAMLAEKV